jgi:hypothetical protein
MLIPTYTLRKEMINQSAIIKRHIAVFFLAVLGFALSSEIQAKTYLGAGGTSCGEYMTIKRAFPDTAERIDLWLLGYVSGLNFSVYVTKNLDLLANQSAADVIGFVQGYCSVNSNKTLNNAANEYWFQRGKAE